MKERKNKLGRKVGYRKKKQERERRREGGEE